jgi:hypothetical protein
MKRPRTPRGSALLTVVILSSILLLVAMGVLSYASSVRQRSINNVRSLPREACAESGLQLARSYFGANFNLWNTYLSTPSVYNPIQSSANSAPADPASAALQSEHPELFADFDGDGKYDVYIYCRDNPDERPPATPNPARDNDQVLIVGSMCISSTMVPRLANGAASAERLTIEGLLTYDSPGQTYRSQAGAGTTGSGNMN